ncbi:hypothetical protein EST38_g12987 [Candolleomyces aberdarensis]|uniref:Uncharacterized protein n=1 Tax=Candolleomyces aberdarensis TaxID=2316362 RepID=A0A4Q2D1T8_9AGAR|nr:hypothetical protein EST38_g12987 [Candolleomyces aberdarensis]
MEPEDLQLRNRLYHAQHYYGDIVLIGETEERGVFICRVHWPIHDTRDRRLEPIEMEAWCIDHFMGWTCFCPDNNSYGRKMAKFKSNVDIDEHIVVCGSQRPRCLFFLDLTRIYYQTTLKPLRYFGSAEPEEWEYEDNLAYSEIQNGDDGVAIWKGWIGFYHDE